MFKSLLMRCVVVAAAAVLAAWPMASLAEAVDRLVVHEWGTFTALQDEAGKSLGDTVSSMASI